MSGLRASQKVTGASDFKITLGNGKARTQIGVLGNRLQPLMGCFRKRTVRGIEEVRISALTASAHTPTQLVQLGQTEGIRAVNNQRICIGNIQTGFHDGRTHQHVKIVVPEINDDAFKLMFVELSVSDPNSRFGNKFLNMRCDRRNGIHAVMHVENLPIAQEFPANRRADLRIGVGTHKGKDGLSFFGRSLEDRHFTNTRNRHLQGSGNRRCRHRENIDIRAQSLERFLVFNAKTLFLVNDDQTQVLESNGTAEQRVGTNHQVHSSRGQAFLDLLCFLRR